MRFIRFPKKNESVCLSHPVQSDKHILVMKNWLYLINIVFSLSLLSSVGFAQEASPAPTQMVEQASGADEDLPSMEEINRRKAYAELRRLEIQNEEDERGMWLAYVMPFAAFIFVLSLLWIIFSYDRKKDRNRHETIRAYLEKGMEVPTELLIDEDHPHAKRATSDLRKGIIWTVVGIGISITALIILGSDRGAALGLIPVCIGIGYLVAAKLDPKPVQEEK